KSGSFTGDATAILAHTGDLKQGAAANLVYSPQDDQDQGTSGSNMTADELTADPLLAGGVDADGATVTPRVAAKNYDFPDLSTPYVTSSTDALGPAHALSAALATDSITNEYMTSHSVGFATDWTFSMPSRRYNVDVDYTGEAANGNKPRAVYAEDAEYFTPTNAKLSTAGAQVCVTSAYADLHYYDTEEGKKSPGGYVISPR